MPVSAAQLMVNIGANVQGAMTGISTVEGALGKGGPLVLAALGAGAVMAGVGVMATKMAGDFQAGITSLATGAGESQSNLQLVRDGILQLARDTGTSTKQLVDGMYMIESGGFHGARGLEILKAAAQGAKVGNADLGVVADTVDTILKNYGENGAMTATQATNALITTVANGKTHLEDLAQSLAFVLPAGSAAGLGLKDVMGAMATMTSVGVPAAESATYLRQMIIALEAPSAGARHELEKIGITSKQLGEAMKQGLPNALQLIETQLAKHGIKAGSAEYVAALREISGGTRQMQGMLNLMGPHLQTFKDDVAKIGGTASSTSKDVKGWAQVQGNMNQQFDRAREVAETLMIQLGTKLLPVATNLFKFLADNALPALKNMATFLSSNSTQANLVKGTLVVFAAVVGGVLVAAFLAWAASAAAAAIATIAATWPILAVGAAIGLLVGLIILAYKNWGWFRAIVDTVREGLQIFWNTTVQGVGMVLGWLGHLKDMFFNLPGPIKAVALIIIGGPIAAIILLVTHLKEVREALGHFKDFLGMVAGKIGEFFGNVFATLGHFKDWILGLPAAIGHFRDEAVKTVSDFITKVIMFFVNLDKQAGEKAKEFVSNIIHHLTDLATNAVNKVTEMRTNLVNKIIEMKNNIVNHAKDLASHFITALTSLPGKLLHLGEQLLQSFAQGLRNARGNVVSAISNIPLIGGAAGAINNMIPKFAFGGVMERTGLALVGERGPELVRLPGGAQVHPLAGAGSHTGGGALAPLPSSLQGASQAININVTVTSTLDGRKVAQGIAPYLHTVLRNATGTRGF